MTPNEEGCTPNVSVVEVEKPPWREAGACSEFQGRVLGDFPEPLQGALVCLGGEEGTVGGTIEEEMCLRKGLATYKRRKK